MAIFDVVQVAYKTGHSGVQDDRDGDVRVDGALNHTEHERPSSRLLPAGMVEWESR